MRLPHEQIRRVCVAEDRKDFVTCPACGGHLHLFGTDDFACMGNSSHSACKPETVAAKLHSIIGNGGSAPKPKQPKPSEQSGWRGLSLSDYCALKRLDCRLMEYLFGARTLARRGNPVAAWSYCDETGKLLATKLRMSSSSHDTYFEPADPHVPYGLHNPLLRNLIAKTYDLIIAEGETDTHTFAAWSFL